MHNSLKDSAGRIPRPKNASRDFSSELLFRFSDSFRASTVKRTSVSIVVDSDKLLGENISNIYTGMEKTTNEDKSSEG